jgi:hypothetical protein
LPMSLRGFALRFTVAMLAPTFDTFYSPPHTMYESTDPMRPAAVQLLRNVFGTTFAAHGLHPGLRTPKGPTNDLHVCAYFAKDVPDGRLFTV